ncbi:MAG: Regulatory sensor-transducer, BlaR1/MecR1 family, partial [Phycisphaerales bacterium]|nr:Regulatory sensor-transducer, BlaR1/MecR1 family [Phycisphaerales bacterium]
MNTLQAWLNGLHASPLTQRLGWVLLHSLWEETAIAALLAVALLLMRRASAAARYAAGCAAIALMALLPILTPAPRVPPVVRHESPPVIAAERRGPAVALPATIEVPHESSASPDRPWLAWAVAAWLLGVGGLSLRHLLGWLLVQRLARLGDEPSHAWRQRLAELAAQLQIRSAVRLRVCARVHVPAVMGWLRPVILIPAAALTDLTPQQLEALLLHELAHVRRHDYVVNLIQTAAETLLFYHPAIWWASRVVRQERENCCDDLAARACGNRVVYARALAAMEELRAVPSRLALAARGGILLHRVRRIVGLPMPERDRWTPVLATFFIASACALLLLTPPRLKAGEGTDAATSPAKAADPGKAQAAGATGIEPDDLKENRAVYWLSRNDLITVSLSELSGPGKETVKTSRINEDGVISLPYVGSLKAAGRTETELEADISKAYKDANLIEHMPVSVTVVEARGRSFSILGDIEKPGNYSIPDAKVRLLDVLALAGGTRGDVTSVLIVRWSNPDAQPKGKENIPPAIRNIEIPGPKLLAGDQDFNVFIRPHDTIVIKAAAKPPAGAAPKTVELRVGKDGLRFEGTVVTWEQLAAALEKLPDHPGTVLNISAESDDLTVGAFFDAQSKAAELVRKYGFKQLTTTGVAPKKAADAAFEIYVGGHVARPG